MSQRASCADLLDGEEIKFGHRYTDLSYDQYAAICARLNAVRASHLKLIRESPRQLRYVLDNPKEETDALRIGKNIHTLFEKPEEFKARLIHVPVFLGPTLKGDMSPNSKAAKEKKAAFLADLPKDSIIADDEEMDLYLGILNVLPEKRLINRLLENCVKECSIFVEDPESGEVLACRPDFITKRGDCCDIKSTRDASMNFFYNDVVSPKDGKLFHALQAAHYAYVLKLAGIGNMDRFAYVAIEKKPPVDMSVFDLNHAHLDFANRWRKHLTKIYSECRQSNTWPGRSDRSQSGDLPQYVEFPPTEGEA